MWNRRIIVIVIVVNTPLKYTLNANRLHISLNVRLHIKWFDKSLRAIECCPLYSQLASYALSILATIVAEFVFGDSRQIWRLSPDSATVAKNGDCRRFWRQSPFSATVDSRRIRRQSPFLTTVAEFGDYSREC